jgi:excinuclease ABC subunit C
MIGVENIKEALKTMPDNSGVYRMIGENDKILYIGKARNLKNRVTNYTNIGQLSGRIARMVFQVLRVEITITNSEAEALLLESNLIKQHKPIYNILLKDDKSYPYIAIDEKHEFPRIAKHRGERKKGVSYFGPYPSAGAVKQAISAIQKVFLIRPCKDSFFNTRKKPCIEYQIKRCSAPCVNFITAENYKDTVFNVKNFLRGKTFDIQKQLTLKMEEAAEILDFERAAEYRNRIRALTSIQSKQNIFTKTLEDADILGIAEEGGEFCIQVFLIRGGHSLGNTEYFPARTEGLSKADVLEYFIGHFYQRNPAPKIIITSEEIPEAPLLEQALNSLADSKVEIIFPQKGEKREVADMAVRNAKMALERKLAEEENKIKVLARIQEVLGVRNAIRRIEVFDNSHIFGKNAVGAMIVAGFDEEGKWGFQKKLYRKFNVASAEGNKGAGITGGDDFYMMRQVLERRYGRLKAEANEAGESATSNFPDLILIDGGLGQLNIATEVFKELGLYGKVDYVGIAKGVDRNSGREDFYLPERNGIKTEPFKLEPNDPALYFLQNLRDEAHRFAITSHRDKRSKAQFTSILDDLDGIGASRKRALLNHFGSAKAVKEAQLHEIENVSGISKKLAKQIWEGLQN